MQWNDDIRIETPEQIDLSLEIAGPGSRFAARVVDWIIKWGILALVGGLTLIVLSLLGAIDSEKWLTIVLGAFLAALFYAFLLGFDIYFEVRQNGQTPGKKYMGVRVLKEGG